MDIHLRALLMVILEKGFDAWDLYRYHLRALFIVILEKGFEP